TDKKMGSVLEESVSLDHLLDARLQMKSMPQKRMAELREFFSPILLPKDNDDLTNSWMKALIDWLKRLKDVDPKAAWLAALKKHLVTLGNSAANLDGASGSGISVWHLRRLNEEHLRHGMLDLIEVWNYAQRLDQPLSAYEQDADIEEDSDE
ncbi:MAG: hypothetical protein ACE5I1_20770, partial [bacterium]